MGMGMGVNRKKWNFGDALNECSECEKEERAGTRKSYILRRAAMTLSRVFA